MAERRMFTKKITDDDHFVNLSSSAQALYFHLSMSADDDGFCNQVTLAMFRSHASVHDLEALLRNRYIYQFENGVIVIKHWRMANALRKDRYTPTAFKEELKRLRIEENGAYTIDENPSSWLPSGCQTVAERLPQDSIGKDSIDNNIYIESNTDVFDRSTSEESAEQFPEIREAWNRLSDVGISPIRKIVPGTSRAKMLKARIRQYGMETVLEAIEKIRESSFLCGGSKQGWSITFDWFTRPNNFPKVLEGNYSDKPKSGVIKAEYTTRNTEAPEEIHEVSDEEFETMVEEGD